MKMFVFISLTALHSILVKSIRCRYMLPTRSNLSLHSILVKSIRLENCADYDRMKTLHSILVKSILSFFRSGKHPSMLYIPFWLNLYLIGDLAKLICQNFTFHSG